MPYVNAGKENGTDIEIYYKDWGKGQPIVFSHGWPLSADDWDPQMLFFLSKGYRVIAHDRRGHGRSTQVADGHDLDHYADDLKAVTDHLKLKDAIHVGHSTGGGEVVRYLGRHGDKNVAKAAIISAVPPLMVKTPANPLGLPKAVFDDLQAQLGAVLDLNRPGSTAPHVLIAFPSYSLGESLLSHYAPRLRSRNAIRPTVSAIHVGGADVAQVRRRRARTACTRFRHPCLGQGLRLCGLLYERLIRCGITLAGIGRLAPP